MQFSATVTAYGEKCAACTVSEVPMPQIDDYAIERIGQCGNQRLNGLVVPVTPLQFRNRGG